ncbi:unnamed protein product [Adineta steineri]|uniref:N-acetyltransferase domain-containing protein n=1 Tax=Adineta steineri TaxID=433720 RepID=A0A818TZC8_9BILA|nr:unnamed protein product [Adineta steineri]CAF3690142.1 unnamed protein product [Adineta steineri]
MGKPAWIYADSTVRHRSGTEAMLQNEDLKVLESDRRLWGTWNYVALWLSDAINIGTWMVISSIITAGDGLSWWEAWICVWIGFTIIAIFICISARTGAVYYISFPVIGRASFGIFGSLWPILNRGIMSCIWYGVQAWIGGQCVVICIRSIIPSYYYLENTLPPSFGTNTRDFIGFMIFWSLSNIAIWFPVYKMRHLFTVKAIVVPIAGIFFFIWVVVKAKGIGAILHQSTILPTTTSSAHVWSWIIAIMSCIASCVTIIVNISDYTRFAIRPSIIFWPQMITIPFAFGITSFIGLIVGLSSKVIYGKEIWNPLDLLNTFLDNMPSITTRIGVFLISLSFCLAQLGVNIAGNSISAGCDLTALCPKYLNIRRSGYICSIVGLCICPWYLLSNSSSFLSYLSSYSTFVSAIIGVLFSDYYLVRREYLDTNELYSASKEGLYYYSYGINWRAYVAYIAGILINSVGFAGAVGASIPSAITKMYHFNFFLGLIVSGGLYYILHILSPMAVSTLPPFTIRSYQPSDVSACQQLMLDVGHPGQHYNHAIHTDMADIEKNYLQIPNAHWWVAVSNDDGRILGQLGVQPLSVSDPIYYRDMAVEERDYICELRRMAIAPDAQRLGIGSRLLAVALDFARHHGYHEMRLATSFHMHKACSFYEKNGFIRGRVARYPVVEVERALQSQERFIDEHRATAVFQAGSVVPDEDQQRFDSPTNKSEFFYRQHFHRKLT